MKKIILFIILLSTLAIAETKTVDMSIGTNVIVENKNITLIDFDDDDRKAIICVNNVKSIVSDEKTVNGVFIDIKSFREDYVRIKIEVNCDEDCECNETCLNQNCFIQKECILDTDCNDNNIFTKDSCINNKCINERTQENKETQDIAISQEKTDFQLFILLSIPILILLIIIIYLVIKK